MQSGKTIDPATLQSLQAFSAAAASGSDEALAAAQAGLPAASPSTMRPSLPPPAQMNGFTPHLTMGNSPTSSNSTFRANSDHGTPALHATSLPPPQRPYTRPTPPNREGSLPQPQLSGTPAPSRDGIDMLASASLAAELDGRKGITPLDAHFRLSSMTEALPVKVSEPLKSHPATHRPSIYDAVGSPSAAVPPPILVKRIIDPDLAVELFRLFFDLCYMVRWE